MVEEGITGRMCQAMYRHAKSNKYMKNYDKNIKSSYRNYLDANNLCGWAVSQKLPVNGFKSVKKDDQTKFNEGFIKKRNENSDKGYILEVDVNYPKKIYLIFIRIYHFYQKERKLKIVKSLFVV